MCDDHDDWYQWMKNGADKQCWWWWMVVMMMMMMMMMTGLHGTCKLVEVMMNTDDGIKHCVIMKTWNCAMMILMMMVLIVIIIKWIILVIIHVHVAMTIINEHNNNKSSLLIITSHIHLYCRNAVPPCNCTLKYSSTLLYQYASTISYQCLCAIQLQHLWFNVLWAHTIHNLCSSELHIF